MPSIGRRSSVVGRSQARCRSYSLGVYHRARVRDWQGERSGRPATRPSPAPGDRCTSRRPSGASWRSSCADHRRRVRRRAGPAAGHPGRGRRRGAGGRQRLERSAPAPPRHGGRRARGARSRAAGRRPVPSRSISPTGPPGTGTCSRPWPAIPWGATASYGEIARRVGAPRAARAVGGAVGRNPISLLIPCHRVIAADGTIGGYGSDGWGSREERLALKRALLLREGVTVEDRAG